MSLFVDGSHLQLSNFDIFRYSSLKPLAPERPNPKHRHLQDLRFRALRCFNNNRVKPAQIVQSTRYLKPVSVNAKLSSREKITTHFEFTVSQLVSCKIFFMLKWQEMFFACAWLMFVILQIWWANHTSVATDILILWLCKWYEYTKIPSFQAVTRYTLTRIALLGSLSNPLFSLTFRASGPSSSIL